MTFAPQQDERIGTINRVIGRNVVHGIYNDGDRTYLTVQQECRNSLPLSSTATTLIVPLTNPNIDFVQFNKSFITLKFEVQFGLTGYAASSGDDDDHMPDAVSTFIGLKHASDIIGEYAVYHKGKQVVGTLQSNATVESFLYHTSRPSTDLENRKASHSISERVAEGDLTSVCGEFFDLKDIQALSPTFNLDVVFEIVIPFNDILIVQQFKSYPNALFGDLELRFKLNLGAFVTLTCNPLKSAESAIRASDDAQWYSSWTNTIGVCGLNYTKEYTQIGDTFTTITRATLNAGKAEYQTGAVSWNAKKISITEAYTTICGYRARPDALEQMRAKYANQPWVMFSQNINYLPFSSKPSQTGLNMTQQVYLNNTTDLILLFPTTANEAGGTVSKNPMLKNLSVQVFNRRYPEVGLNTTDGKFLHLMLHSFVTNHAKPLQEYVK